jgi:hypothetical protein
MTLGLRCKNLEFLELTFNEKITDEGALAVGVSFTKLKVRHFIWMKFCACDDFGLMEGYDTTYNQRLGMQRCSGVSSEGWKALFPNLHQLQLLDISVNKNVTDDCLIALSQSCRALQHLNLRRTRFALCFARQTLPTMFIDPDFFFRFSCSITDVGVRELGSIKTLKLLDVTECVEVTDLSAVLQNCHQLETLALQVRRNTHIA